MPVSGHDSEELESEYGGRHGRMDGWKGAGGVMESIWTDARSARNENSNSQKYVALAGMLYNTLARPVLRSTGG